MNRLLPRYDSAGIDPNYKGSLLGVNFTTGAVYAISALSLTNAKPLTVALVDGTGTQLTSFGGTSSSFGSAFPATGTAAGFTDGTNMRGARVFDIDTGAGTEYVTGTNLRISASGGSIEAKGQQTMANSLPVVFASDQSALTVTATNLSTNIAQINGVTPLMGVGNTGTGSPRVTLATDQAAIATWGKGATGAAVPSGAQYEGFNAATALPTAATAGNLTGAMSDKFGRQVVLPVTVRDLVGTQTTTISASTAETTIVTAAASTFNDLLLLVCSNTSATAARIDFRDTTAGSVLFSIYVPAGDVRGFSLGGVPIPQTTINTNWTAQSSASVTDLRIYAVFAKNK